MPLLLSEADVRAVLDDARPDRGDGGGADRVLVRRRGSAAANGAPGRRGEGVLRRHAGLRAGRATRWAPSWSRSTRATPRAGCPRTWRRSSCSIPATGALRAIVDGRYITEARTAAVSAVATRLLARPDAGVLALIGSGVQARSHLAALARVRTLREVRVWSPDPARRRRSSTRRRSRRAAVARRIGARGGRRRRPRRARRRRRDSRWCEASGSRRARTSAPSARAAPISARWTRRWSARRALFVDSRVGGARGSRATSCIPIAEGAFDAVAHRRRARRAGRRAGCAGRTSPRSDHDLQVAGHGGRGRGGRAPGVRAGDGARARADGVSGRRGRGLLTALLRSAQRFFIALGDPLRGPPADIWRRRCLRLALRGRVVARRRRRHAALPIGPAA